MNTSPNDLYMMTSVFAIVVVGGLCVAWIVTRIVPLIVRLVQLLWNVSESIVCGAEAWAVRKRLEAQSQTLRAFPVQVPGVEDRPGCYCVSGVVRQTEEEADWHIEARTRAGVDDGQPADADAASPPREVA